MAAPTNAPVFLNNRCAGAQRAGIDAAPIDGPPIDGPPIDAPPPIDAGAAEPFTVTLSPPPIVPRTGSGLGLIEMARVTNNLTRRLNVDFTFTGGFTEAGRCINMSRRGRAR